MGGRLSRRFDRCVSDRYFGVNDGVDDQHRVFGTLCERPSEPNAPLRIVGVDIEQDVAIHRHSTASAYARSQPGQRGRHFRRLRGQARPELAP